jgi:hypothetical protein
MSEESLFNEPVRRRLWLINKALENAPLAEALALAQVAEAFLAGTPFGKSPAAPIVSAVDPPTSPQSEVEHPSSLPPFHSVTVSADDPPTSPQSEVEHPSSLSPFHSVTVSADDPPTSPQSEVEHPSSLPPFDSVIASSSGNSDGQVDNTPSAPFDASISPVSAHDVVRYLRQRDDVVVPIGDGAFLVNGRFRETLGQLVERANRMRARQHLPRFGVLPQVLPADGKTLESAPT